MEVKILSYFLERLLAVGFFLFVLLTVNFKFLIFLICYHLISKLLLKSYLCFMLPVQVC